jgi:hypothetical protein
MQFVLAPGLCLFLGSVTSLHVRSSAAGVYPVLLPKRLVIQKPQAFLPVRSQLLGAAGGIFIDIK